MIGTTAILDACVLFPASLRDVLLYAAKAELYYVRLSELILSEVYKNLVAKKETTPEKAEKLIHTIRRAIFRKFDRE